MFIFYLCSSVCNESFSLTAFKIFSLLLVCSSLIMMCLGMCVILDWGLMRVLDLWVHSPSILENFWSLFLQIVFYVHSSEIPVTHMLGHLMLFQRSLRLCAFFPLVLSSVLHFGELLFPFLQVYWPFLLQNLIFSCSHPVT